MDHGGHGGHDMPMPMCSMHMLWNTQVVDTCIVFSSWHIHSTAQFILSFGAILLLSVSYEYLRLFQQNFDAQIRRRKRAASPIASGRSTPSERGENVGLLGSGRSRVRSDYRALRAVSYGASVFLSCFLMLVFMTYNAYLILAVVAGAAIGHYFFSGSVETEGRGVSCH